MKKIISFLAFALICFSSIFSKAAERIESIKIVDITNNELIIAINVDNSNRFTEYYSVQYDNIDFSFLSNHENFALEVVSPSHLILIVDNVHYVLEICENDNSSGNYCVYGITYHLDENSFTLITGLTTGTLDDVVKSNGPLKPKVEKLTCTSGGVGATQCSTGSGIGSVNTECSVSCGSGYYACCDDNVTKCKCIKSGTLNASPGNGNINYY